MPNVLGHRLVHLDTTVEKPSAKDGHQVRCPVEDAILYVCPTPGCGSYYSSPNFRPDKVDLNEPQDRRTEEGPKHDGAPRGACPVCKTLGMTVMRKPYLIIDVIPLDI